MPSSTINRADCRKKMNKRKAIVATRFQEIASQLPKGSPEFNYFEPISHNTPRNVFYFDRIDVLSIFLTEVEIAAIADKGTNFLAVVLGAHDKATPEFLEGQPTTILMGVQVTPNALTGEFDLSQMKVVPLGSLNASTTAPAPVLADPEAENIGYEYPPSSGINDVPPSV